MRGTTTERETREGANKKKSRLTRSRGEAGGPTEKVTSLAKRQKQGEAESRTLLPGVFSHRDSFG